ncbi:MAG: type II toxin-antitoxin system RelE/ParE family toxin [Chloroflexi bacterium]|nr:type II toxin-antitoxin system RelE/ParE family toxin [Chloroflexota bacterium]
MSYEITVCKAAQRQWHKLPAKIRARIGKALLALEEEPRPGGVIKLKGAVDRWRIRVGNYRIIYRIDDNEKSVVVLVIAHRREAYR